MVEGLTIPIIIATAALDSINPCGFGVLLFLIAYMTNVINNKNMMLLAAGIYIAAVYVTYFLAGLGVLAVAKTFFGGFSKVFYKFAATLAIAAGVFEVKDYFWYGKGFSLQLIPGASDKLKEYVKVLEEWEVKYPKFSLAIAAFLGGFATLVELPCTGAPYLAVLGLLSQGNYSEGIPLLLLYNLVFILPLFVIVGMVYFGTTSQALEGWRKENRGLMRLGIGLFLIGLGAYMWWAVL